MANYPVITISRQYGSGGREIGRLLSEMLNIPYYDNDEFAEKIEKLIQRGVRIVITTQVPHEGSDMSIYHVGLRIKQNTRSPRLTI